LPKHKIINMGYPRCDQLILARKDPLGERPRLMCSQFVKDISANSRVILYTPTWRPYSYKLPLLEMPGFSLEKFENWLAREDAYFFITTHSANPPNHAPYSNQRFQVLSNLQRPLFDVSMFMTEADLLVNDYSTTSVDFALTQRPQIFFMPDYDLYQKEKGFIEFYKDCLVGPEVSNYDDFTEKLLMALKEPNVFESEFSLKKKVLLQKYYTSTTSNSTGRWTAFIKALCSNSR
jgi:CDP-glycerol glycerophosphotransferase (TagB/SpsB family)